MKTPQKKPIQTTPVKKLPPAVRQQAEAAKPMEQLPAPWPTQKQVKELAWLLDMEYPHFRDMQNVLSQLDKASHYQTRKRIIREAIAVIDNFEKTGGRSGARDRLEKRWHECEPDNWSDDNCNPRYGEVAKMIGGLMGSFPTSKIPDPEIFVNFLIEDVMELTPSFVELECTCRALRTNKDNKFMPTISEVLEELEKQKELWDRRSEVADRLEASYDELRAEIASFNAEDHTEEERKAREARETAHAAYDSRAAKTREPSVGDRVRHYQSGVGTVLEKVPSAEFTGTTQIRVRFDTGACQTIGYGCLNGGLFLERLLPDEEGYQPPAPAVPMDDEF
jgi:hypothetical protein